MPDDLETVGSRMAALRERSVTLAAALRTLKGEDAEAARDGLKALTALGEVPESLASIPVAFQGRAARKPIQDARAIGEELDAILAAIRGTEQGGDHEDWVESLKTASLWFCEF